MKKNNTVGLYGEVHGLSRNLIRDLPSLGFTPFKISDIGFSHPLGTVAVICLTWSDLITLQKLMNSLEEDQIHLVYASFEQADGGSFDIKAESAIRDSGLPYTLIRVVGVQKKNGDHHKLFWSQDFPGEMTANRHSVRWEDFSQVLCHCVNRPQVLSKTFTVHAVAGKAVHNWDEWFLGMISDSMHPAPQMKEMGVWSNQN